MSQSRPTSHLPAGTKEMPARAGRAGGSPEGPLARRVLLHPLLASLLPRLAGREEGGTENPFAGKEPLLSQLAHTPTRV